MWCIARLISFALLGLSIRMDLLAPASNSASASVTTSPFTLLPALSKFAASAFDSKNDPMFPIDGLNIALNHAMEPASIRADSFDEVRVEALSSVLDRNYLLRVLFHWPFSDNRNFLT